VILANFRTSLTHNIYNVYDNMFLNVLTTILIVNDLYLSSIIGQILKIENVNNV